MATKSTHKKKIKEIRIDKKFCKACGICIEFCPTKVFDADEFGYPVVARLDACTGCKLCEDRCPDLAIEVIEEKKEEKEEKDGKG